MKKVSVLLFFALAISSFGEDSVETAPLKVQVDLGLGYFPYNIQHSYGIPGMKQAVDLSAASFESVFYPQEKFLAEVIPHGVKNIFGWELTPFDVGLYVWSALVLEYFLWMYLPLGDIWLHENFHQAVLMNRGISSYNGVYDFKLGASVISVTRVTDSDLAGLKNQSQAEFIRLHSAGIEGQTEFVNRLDQNRFVQGNRVSIALQIAKVMNLLNNSAYLFSTAHPSGSSIVSESGNQLDKDIVGLDFTAWVYELFRPSLPYSARPALPDGSGITRYITYEMLSPEELSYLTIQAFWSLGSFLDTSLFFGGDFRGRFFDGSTYQWSANLRHYLTPYGGALHARIYYKSARFISYLSFWNSMNRNSYFPGIDVHLFEVPTPLAGLTADFRTAVWLQPEDFKFEFANYAPGGLISLRLKYSPHPSFGVWLEGLGKSAGWVPGIEELTPALRSAAGVTISF